MRAHGKADVAPHHGNPNHGKHQADAAAKQSFQGIAD